MSDNKNAGAYQLVSFEISTFPNSGKTVDIRALVHVWNLEESMLKGSIRGTAKVYDATGVFYNFPLRGQERIRIVYKDFFDEEREEDLFLYAVTDITPAGLSADNVLEYTLHFTSFGKLWSDRYEVKRCIAEGTLGDRRYIPINEQVQVIFDDYYSTDGNGTQKEIQIHETDGEQSIVIPGYKAEEAMHLMSRRAYSATYQSNLYRFFENRDKYCFINIEQWIEDYPRDEESQPTYNYARSKIDQSPEAEVNKMSSIISMAYGTFTNTMDKINLGGYYRKVSEIDLQNRVVNNYTYNHLEEFKDFIWPDMTSELQLRHTDDMITQHMNKEYTTYVIKDYPSDGQSGASALRPDPHYGEIQTTKLATMAEYGESRITATIFGNNKIVAGSMIFLELPMFKPAAQVDAKISERYIVESIQNEFIEDTYYQQLVLIKGPMLMELNTNGNGGNQQ